MALIALAVVSAMTDGGDPTEPPLPILAPMSGIPSTSSEQAVLRERSSAGPNVTSPNSVQKGVGIAIALASPWTSPPLCGVNGSMIPSLLSGRPLRPPRS